MAEDFSRWLSKLKLTGIKAANRLPPRVRQAINSARGISTPTLVNSLSGERVVVLSPHPDDELIGAGGAITAHLAAGNQVHIIQMTSGEATVGLSHLAPAERIALRESESIEAAKRIGLAENNVSFVGFGDGKIGKSTGDSGATSSNSLALRKLTSALTRHEPDLIYAPWPIDAHHDHVATTRLLGDAIRNGQLPKLKSVALYEVWTPLIPTHLVDIGEHLEQKLHALEAYQSALVSVDYLHTTRGMAAYRSAQGLHGRGYAEAFCVLSPQAFLELLYTTQ